MTFVHYMIRAIQKLLYASEALLTAFVFRSVVVVVVLFRSLFHLRPYCSILITLNDNSR